MISRPSRRDSTGSKARLTRCRRPSAACRLRSTASFATSQKLSRTPCATPHPASADASPPSHLVKRLFFKRNAHELARIGTETEQQPIVVGCFERRHLEPALGEA